MNKFNVLFLEEASRFVDDPDSKTREKILFNIRKARQSNDPKLFKKLQGEIWEFRTKFNKNQYSVIRILGQRR